MSLVQPTRAPNSNGNNVGVKRPYQLMINSAAHVSTSDGSYSRAKNLKLDKDIALEDINEDNLVCLNISNYVKFFNVVYFFYKN